MLHYRTVLAEHLGCVWVPAPLRPLFFFFTAHVLQRYRFATCVRVTEACLRTAQARAQRSETRVALNGPLL